ncbi:STAS domain-containing protein [Streptomyces kunmingensis]|uniref:STAS domain-containing protein n=1 Tax=Streptomyces kunmingensis TaxID=68225 RepID=A0ABU6C4G9_9ACTN|nr:STAS domain-containing protein [Streptomyces kunmingensis]MEB3958730.1 STAS domain-containing protein [Streptomyces kunmingensis]
MNITTELDGHRATLTPHGDIDFDAMDHLQTSLVRLPSAVTRVVWDLHDVPFVDIAGLHLLATSLGPVQSAVTHLNPQALGMLRLACELFPHMGFERHLPDAPQLQPA